MYCFDTLLPSSHSRVKFVNHTCRTGTVNRLPSKFEYTSLGGGNNGNLTNPSMADHQLTIFSSDPCLELALA